jgi:hypothetical protein
MERLVIFAVGVVVGMLARNKIEEAVVSVAKKIFPSFAPQTDGREHEVSGAGLRRWRPNYLDH